MPTLKLALDQYERPIVQVQLAPSVVQQRTLYAPPSVVPTARIFMLVDTGASHTVVAESVIAHWRLPQISAIANWKNGKLVPTGIRYDLSLRMHMPKHAHAWFLTSFPVGTEADKRFEDQAFHGYIGMDLLRMGTLSYDGLTAEFLLGFK